MPRGGNTMEATTVDTRRHLGAQAWREVFSRFEGSGESVVGFCRREGLNTSSFHRWRRRLLSATATAGAVREVRSVKRQPPPAASFIEMATTAAASAAAGRLEVRLDLGAGLVLHVVRG